MCSCVCMWVNDCKADTKVHTCLRCVSCTCGCHCRELQSSLFIYYYYYWSWGFLTSVWGLLLKFPLSLCLSGAGEEGGLQRPHHANRCHMERKSSISEMRSEPRAPNPHCINERREPLRNGPAEPRCLSESSVCYQGLYYTRTNNPPSVNIINRSLHIYDCCFWLTKYCQTNR